MSNYKGGWFRRIFSFNKSKDKCLDRKEEQKQAELKHELAEKAIINKRLWKKNYKPQRQILLWGWDENNNPSFLVLYGVHEFNCSHMEGVNILEKEVKYTSYAIWKGKEGHLPSFPAVKIVDRYDYVSRRWVGPRMYYKKGLKYLWSWRPNEEYLVKSYYELPAEQHISFDFFKSWEQSDYVREIRSKNISFQGFRQLIALVRL